MFSPDGKKFGYVANTATWGPNSYGQEQYQGGYWVAVINGIEGKHYPSVNSLQFSPDSKHYAYFNFTSPTVILDGKESIYKDSVSGLSFDSKNNLAVKSYDNKKEKHTPSGKGEG